MLAYTALALLLPFYYAASGLPDAGPGYQGLLLSALVVAMAAGLAFDRAQRAGLPGAGRQSALLALAQLPFHAANAAFFVLLERRAGGQARLAPAILPLVGAGGCWAWAAGRRRDDGQRVLAGLAAACLLAAGLILTARLGAFSDPLLYVQTAGLRFLRGQSVYRGLLPVWPTVSIRFLYLPGLWLPYVPGLAMGWDPRWMGLVGLAAFSGGTWAAAPPSRRALAAGLLLLYLADPCLTFRHDTYLPVLLAYLGLAVWARAQGWAGTEGAAWGLLFGASQLFWPLAPMVAVGLAVRRTWRARGAALAGFGVALALVWADAAWREPAAFAAALTAVFHSPAAVASAHLNLAYWLPSAWLRPLQALALALGSVWAWRDAGQRQPWMALGCAQAAFLLLVPHTEHYYWLLPLALWTEAWIQDAR